tara:strand:- start:1054 stop:1677 length:624 start_codon:yes stop_codon:yes gene_type:complete
MAKNIMVIEGSAQWAKVLEPDTKWNPLGDYTINLQMSQEEAAPLCEKLEQLVQEEFKKAVKEKPPLKNTLTTQDVSSVVYDRDTGDDTGKVEFKFKLKAKVQRKDGGYYEQQPAVLDAKKQPLPKDMLIGNGSKVKVAFEPITYIMQSTKKVGVSLRLKAVQVIDLVEYGNSATSLFDEEDGFVAPTSEAAPFETSTTEDLADAADF